MSSPNPRCQRRAVRLRAADRLAKLRPISIERVQTALDEAP